MAVVHKKKKNKNNPYICIICQRKKNELNEINPLSNGNKDKRGRRHIILRKRIVIRFRLVVATGTNHQKHTHTSIIPKYDRKTDYLLHLPFYISKHSSKIERDSLTYTGKSSVIWIMASHFFKLCSNFNCHCSRS